MESREAIGILFFAWVRVHMRKEEMKGGMNNYTTSLDQERFESVKGRVGRKSSLEASEKKLPDMTDHEGARHRTLRELFGGMNVV